MSDISYELINQSGALGKALEGLGKCRCIALDLEMENQRHHYGLHIALIQISTQAGRNFIFDPLAGLDIKPLLSIISNPDVELIVHDADFDRRAFRKIYGLDLNRVFDTKIAAQLCGFRRFGLGSLLESLVNVSTDKKFQKINWLQRPLPKEALDYAARDTASLHRLKDILSGKLRELGRLEWAREEFICSEKTGPEREPLPLHHRIKRSSLLTPRQLAVLKSLAAFRDDTARSINRPAHFIVRNELLLKMAVCPPETVQDLRKIKGLHPVLYREHMAGSFLEAVRRGMSAPEEKRPGRLRRPRSHPGYAQRLKDMHLWRSQAAAPYDMEPHLILPNDVLQWVSRHPSDPMPPEVAGQIRDWQKKNFWEQFASRFMISASPCLFPGG